ncbi:MAG: WYL domain-containing protein [Actinomycetaceae bacterium]|nr:WYL domain-containing protein [Actinomycetaceae bacterium]
MSSETINNSMIKTGTMIAILSHLARHDEVSLGELADRFNMQWKEIYLNLWTMHMIEVDDIDSPMPPSPFDVFGTASMKDFPPPTDDKVPSTITKNTLLPPISPQASREFISVSFSLPELVLIVHTLDELLEVTPPSHGRTQLSDIRDNLAASAHKLGYDAVIWERAEDIIAGDLLDTIIRALDDGHAVHLTYSTFDDVQCVENIKEYEIIPLRLDGGAHPVLRADLYDRDAEDGEGGARSFRLDRISEVSLGEKVSKGRIAQGRERMEEDAASAKYDDSPTTISITTTREALWAAEELPEVDVEETGDVLVMTLPARNYDFIARFVALMGTNVIAIEPPEVAERVSDIFAALAAAYSDVELSGKQC